MLHAREIMRLSNACARRALVAHKQSRAHAPFGCVTATEPANSIHSRVADDGIWCVAVCAHLWRVRFFGCLPFVGVMQVCAKLRASYALWHTHKTHNYNHLPAIDRNIFKNLMITCTITRIIMGCHWLCALSINAHYYLLQERVLFANAAIISRHSTQLSVVKCLRVRR